MKGFLKLFSINILLFIGIFIFLELIAKGFNIFLRKSSPDALWMNMNLDPAVGLSHDINDFQYLGNDKKNNTSRMFFKKSFGNGEKNLSVHVFGGSTSDPLGLHFSGKNGTWPEHFGNYLVENKNIKLNLLNFAVGGAQSSQELFRLIASLKHNDPDIFISFSGLNEVYFKDDLYENNDNIYAPFIIINDLDGAIIDLPSGRYFRCNFFCFESTNLFRFLGEGILRLRQNVRLSWRNNGIRPVDKVGFWQAKVVHINNNKFLNKLSLKQELLIEEKIKLDNAAQIWEENVTMMNSIAESLNKKYYVFLQPIYGLGLSRDQIIKNSKIKGEENRYLNIGVSSLMGNGPEIYDYLFDKLKQKCKKLPFCIDATVIEELRNDLTLYSFDNTHPNSNGNKIIGKFIADRIKKDCIEEKCFNIK